MKSLSVSVLLLVIAATIAHAQPSPAERAKAHYKQGRAYVDAGSYLRAAEEYRAAYALDPRPEMLFNIAQAFRLAGEKQRALEHYKQYLDVQPGGAGADEARQHVATLTRQLDEERAHATRPIDPQPAEPLRVPTATPRSDVPGDTSAAPGRGLRIAGIATTGAGLIGVAIGIKLGLDARSIDNELSDFQGPWTMDHEARFAEGEAKIAT